MNKFYATIKEFTLMLIKNEIPFSFSPFHDGGQWTFKEVSGDIAIHSGTYHNDEGYLESYRMPWDGEDVSVCAPAEMISRLKGNPPNEEYEYFYNTNDLLKTIFTMLDLGE